MRIDVLPATGARFEDVTTMVGPKNPQSNVCWCLSHRLDARTNQSLVGPARGEFVRELTRQPVAPGVLAYDGDEVVGWAAVAPRAGLPFARSRKIPHVDDLPVWSAWCIRVRPGHRGSGISHDLLRGAVAYAQEQGAPAGPHHACQAVTATVGGCRHSSGSPSRWSPSCSSPRAGTTRVARCTPRATATSSTTLTLPSRPG